ncbi:hypothetical protein Hanom_Chr17g01530271 [Helianthus anomalus]
MMKQKVWKVIPEHFVRWCHGMECILDESRSLRLVFSGRVRLNVDLFVVALFMLHRIICARAQPTGHKPVLPKYQVFFVSCFFFNLTSKLLLLVEASKDKVT